jgi:hypothetical protein
VKWHKAGWRMTLVAGCVAGVAALSPLIAAADEDPPLPSGAVIALGGVSIHDPGRGRGHGPGGVGLEEASLASRISGDADQVGDEASLGIARVGESRPLVLPNTGGGPVDDENTIPFLPIFAAVLAAGTGGYLGLRRSARRIRVWQ